MAATQPERRPKGRQSETPLSEIYRRLVEIHYPLAEAPRVDSDLHRWTLQRLSALLEYVDDIEHPKGTDRAG